MSTFSNNGYVADGHRIARPRSNHPAPGHWRVIRGAALERDRHACRTCWRTENDGYALECHHRHYDNWGAEQLDDVVILCIRCHDLHTDDVRRARHAATSLLPVYAVPESSDSFVSLVRNELGTTPHRESLATFVPTHKRLHF